MPNIISNVEKTIAPKLSVVESKKYDDADVSTQTNSKDI